MRTQNMLDAMLLCPKPCNEPVKSYAPATPERALLQQSLARMRSEPIEVAMRIDGREVRTKDTCAIRSPHDHGQQLGSFHQGTSAHMDEAIEAALKAAPVWSAMPWNARASVFLKAAELLSGTYRQAMNASTMLGQSKTAHQSEIDAVCEMVDFFRFNCAFLVKLMSEQPESSPGVWNQLDYRPLEGFVLAISPFNFTSIAANLPAAPALMGNTVVWKPSLAAMHSTHYILKLFEDAGMPPGVINMVTGDPEPLVRRALSHPSLAGVHFTGSTAVFRSVNESVASNLSRYRAYPRLVGETGGKDFVFAHMSADPDALAVALLRGAYEYQGQKCSAASRAFVPRSLWPKVRERLVAMIDSVKVGDICDFTNFMGAVIDERAYKRITGYVSRAAADAGCTILRAGASSERGWLVRPTLIEVRDPSHELMRDELFGPVLSVFEYPDAELDRALSLCDTGSAYALTGAVFARDRLFIERASLALRNSAGNFYINDKPTGAVVGQQPFGGARASGTNDKAGSALNLLRWVSPRTIKETFSPPTSWRYPFMDE